ncbi:uncharacterized protein LOC105209254 [Zeugodacus cucurbitae]|uniref:uncharacterized protein LOC105209254 n=1 Tax=Zeugodacus cucurbitae TaxID=28588 RepID=UPI0023D92E3E|nr:uncharacterized protein LOC105209254 [Zeugodacus cucurbitae]
MKIMLKFKLFVLFACLAYSCAEAVEIDCRRPPQLVQPNLCCKGGDSVPSLKTCAQRLGVNLEDQTGAIPLQTAACFAECIVKESQYITEPEKVNFEALQTYLQTKSDNDTTYVDTMMTAYKKCELAAQQRMQMFQQIPYGGGAIAQRRICSPFYGILLSCVHMEYFMNCPAQRWNENEECALAKQFVKQCTVGAS